MRDLEQTQASRGYEVLFPVAVGGVFLVVLVIGALLTLIGNLLADVSYALVDPRIRHN